VPYVGTVVNGIVNSGRVKTGDSVLFGPDSNGNYQTTVVKSMQRKRFVVTCLMLHLRIVLEEVETVSHDANQSCYSERTLYPLKQVNVYPWL
jgi:GTPase